ncbi:AfsR/SARP family transcriptional regulator [Lachnospiraceae bacterium LCP25S3_G4]
MKETKSMLEVKMLGGFEMKKGGQTLHEEDMNSEMLVKLISYCLCHRERAIPTSELSDNLWTDDQSDNPAGALKNLMYRLRILLKETFGDVPFIITGRGFYQWNPEMNVKTDLEELETYVRIAKQPGLTKEERTLYYKSAVEVYKGMFLPRLSAEYWTIPFSTYYHSIYLSALKELALVFLDMKEDKKAEEICVKAVELEPFDEEMQAMLIRSLMNQKKWEIALEHYRKVICLLREQWGVTSVPILQELYNEIIRKKKGKERLVTIKEIGMVLENEVKDGDTAVFTIRKNKQKWELVLVTDM